MFNGLRDVLLLVLVFFISFIFEGLIYGPILTVLFYFFLRYYRRTKELEKRLADLTGDKPESNNVKGQPSADSPSSSTDA